MEIRPTFGAVLGLAVVAIGGYALWRAAGAVVGIGDAFERARREAAQALSEAASAVGDALSTAADAVNPTSANNLAYRGANAGLTAWAGEPTYASDILFSILNPGARAAEQDMLSPQPQVTVWDIEDAELGMAMRADALTPGGAFTGGMQHIFGRGRGPGRA